MSNRVRILLHHPEHGPFINGSALRTVEHNFALRQTTRKLTHAIPELFMDWPRWKRCSWMAKKLGPSWKLQVFRESRRVKARTSLFWKAALGMGFAMPNRPKKLKAKVAKPIAGADVNVRYIDELLGNVAQGINDANQARLEPEAVLAGGLRGHNPGGNMWQNIWANAGRGVGVPVVAEAPAPGPRGPNGQNVAGRQYHII